MFAAAVTAALFLTLWLTSCKPTEPVLAPSPTPPSQTPAPSAVATAEAPIPNEVIIATPVLPMLTKAGRDLIYEFETGGRDGYNRHPEWPGGASGITIGIGYDEGYCSTAVFESDWHKLPDISLRRLAQKVGLTGSRARNALSDVRDILVEWDLATDVFDNVDVARWFATTRHVLPGFEKLRPNAQAALVSLGFNRGWSMIGSRRVECRAIRDECVLNQDYACIAREIRAMEHLWAGTDIERGMTRRREAEARLALTP